MTFLVARDGAIPLESRFVILVTEHSSILPYLCKEVQNGDEAW